jgi:hypothetical protein
MTSVKMFKAQGREWAIVAANNVVGFLGDDRGLKYAYLSSLASLLINTRSGG